MDTKHTPGPWISAEPYPYGVQVSSTNGYVCRVSESGKKSTEEQRANARLIAAAPDLLAALEDAIAKMKQYIPKAAQGYDNGCFKYVGMGEDFDCSCAICKARAAIAKATQP